MWHLARALMFAGFLLSTIRGLRVSAKADVEPEDLRAIATLALSSLKPR